MSSRDNLYDDPEESLRIALTGWQSRMWTAMPGIVVDFDSSSMTATIQPSIQGEIEDEFGKTTYVNLPTLIHCPVVFPQGGGFVFTMPITTGDEVLIIFGSRCIDSWWQSSGIQKAAEFRMHDLSDGFCLPGPFSKPKAPVGVSTTNAQLRTLAGTSFIELTPAGQINLVSPTGINITGPTSITGPLTLAGAVAVTGNISSTGSVSASIIATTSGIGLATHKHPGVTTGSGTSGAAIP